MPVIFYVQIVAHLVFLHIVYCYVLQCSVVCVIIHGVRCMQYYCNAMITLVLLMQNVVT